MTAGMGGCMNGEARRIGNSVRRLCSGDFAAGAPCAGEIHDPVCLGVCGKPDGRQTASEGRKGSDL